MSFVEQAGLSNKIAKFVALKAQIGPTKFGDRACPCVGNEGRRKFFTKRPIKSGIVGNDKVGRLDQRVEGGDLSRLGSWRRRG